MSTEVEVAVAVADDGDEMMMVADKEKKRDGRRRRNFESSLREKQRQGLRASGVLEKRSW